MYIYGIWQTPLSVQSRVEGLAQGPNNGNLVVVGFEPGIFRTVVQCWGKNSIVSSVFVKPNKLHDETLMKTFSGKQDQN